MSETEYKRYDTDANYGAWAIRLAKDAETKEGEFGKMVRITFVDTSRAETDMEMWIEGTVNDGQAELATALRKGDVIPGVEGKLTAKQGNNGKVFYNLRRTRLHLGAALLKELRERGGTSGAAQKPAARGAKPVTKPAAKPAGRRKPIVEIPDDEDE